MVNGRVAYRSSTPVHEIFRAPVVWEQHEQEIGPERAKQPHGVEPPTQSKGATLLVCAFEACFAAARRMKNSEQFVALGFDLVKSVMEGGCINAPQAYTHLFGSVMMLQSVGWGSSMEGPWKWILREFAAFYDIAPAHRLLTHILWAAYHQATESVLSNVLSKKLKMKPLVRDAHTETHLESSQNQSNQSNQSNPNKVVIVEDKYGVANSPTKTCTCGSGSGVAMSNCVPIYGVAVEKENFSTQAAVEDKYGVADSPTKTCTCGSGSGVAMSNCVPIYGVAVEKENFSTQAAVEDKSGVADSPTKTCTCGSGSGVAMSNCVPIYGVAVEKENHSTQAFDAAELARAGKGRELLDDQVLKIAIDNGVKSNKSGASMYNTQQPTNETQQPTNEIDQQIRIF
ncbi:hypothetical protein BSKO_03706 [Bryopsis sp. KO-2023]|nr:hypothetical protein BSKO_03706 [Bryopsis sp. KO-2023]